MLQAEAPGDLPPPGAFLFSGYFHDSRVEMVMVRQPGRTITIDIRSGSLRHFVGSPHRLLSWKYTLNNFSSPGPYSKYLLNAHAMLFDVTGKEGCGGE